MRHTHATHAYAMLYTHTYTWSIMVYVRQFLCFEVHSFRPPVTERNMRNYFGVMHFIVFHSYLQYPCRGGTAGANERESIDWTCL